jgi:carbamoyltransferase
MKLLKCNTEQEVLEEATRLLVSGNIIGWFNGKSEYGPRALGNRSILADPQIPDIKERINNLKRRESWRPFAPVVLEEEYKNWFDLTKPSPYMLFSAQILESKLGILPGIEHLDGSARPQTVTASQNPKLHSLLKVFFFKTGVPVLLNTSFNVREPIVETPKDAINTFLSSDLDALVMGNYILKKGVI